MRKMRIGFLSLIALALLIGPGTVKNADAKVRVKATVKTPNVKVRFANAGAMYQRTFVPRNVQPRLYPHCAITPRDRKIARRLSNYTGVPARRMIRMKGKGYTWFEIGHWLGVRPVVVRAAMSRRSWKRFLRHQRRFDRCGSDSYSLFGALNLVLSGD